MKLVLVKLIIVIATIGVGSPVFARQECGRNSDFVFQDQTKFLIDRTIHHCRKAKKDGVKIPICDDVENYTVVGGMGHTMPTTGRENIWEITLLNSDQLYIKGLMKCDSRNKRFVLYSTLLSREGNYFGFVGIRDYEP